MGTFIDGLDSVQQDIEDLLPMYEVFRGYIHEYPIGSGLRNLENNIPKSIKSFGGIEKFREELIAGNIIKFRVDYYRRSIKIIGKEEDAIFCRYREKILVYEQN